MNRFLKTTAILSSIVLVSAGGYTLTKEVYRNGQASVKPQIEQNQNDMQDKLNQVQIDLANKETENKELKTQVTALTNEKTKLQASYNQSQEEVEELNAQITTLNANIQEKDTANTNLQTQVKNLETEKQELIASGQASQEEIDNLNNQITTLNAIIEQNNADKSVLQIQVTNLETEKSLLTTQNAEYQTQINTLSMQIDNLNTTITQNEAEISTLNSKVSTLTSIVDKSVTEITAEDLEGFSEISSYMFAGCTSLTSVTIPENISSIGNNAFEGCTNLSTMTVLGDNVTLGTDAIPSTISSIKVNSEALATYKTAENWSELADKFTLAPNLPSDWLTYDGTTSSYMVVKGTSTLPTDLVIPSTYNDGVNGVASVTSIGDSAFFEEYGLTTITIPNSVTNIGIYALAMSYLTTITFENDSQLRSIGQQAFTCCSLKNITIPASVTNIGDGAFNECRLTSVTFESGSQLTTIESGAFQNADNLTSIVIPAGVTSLESYTFGNCHSLTSITFESDSQLTNIGNHAFEYCGRLTSITIPASVTSIGDFAFYDSGLINVMFESNSRLTTIGNSAFSYNTNLTGITIPSSITSIGDCAFENCRSLTEITILAITPPSLIAGAIPDNVNIIYIPAGALEAYQTATNWSAYADKFVELEA